MLISKKLEEYYMKLKYITIVLFALLLSSCNKFLDIRPTGMVIARTGEEYRALLIDKYSQIPQDRSKSDLRTDDANVDFSKATNSSDYKNWYFDIWTWTDYNRDELSKYFDWQGYYEVSYIANYIIEHQNEIEETSISEINQLVGESYMLRAYMHFLLVNLYAPSYTKCEPSATRGVPLQLKADITQVLRCSSVAQVYQQILSDIDMAEQYMNVEKWEKGYTYRFSKITANALRARVALYMGNWQLAYNEAIKVKEKYPDLEDLNTSTTMPNSYESVESILALEKEVGDFPISNGKKGFLWASDDLLKTYGFDPQTPGRVLDADYIDLRVLGGQLTRPTLTGKFFDCPYISVPRLFSLKPLGRDLNEYRCTFRAAEFYLIIAEAANELGNIAESKKNLKDLMIKRFDIDSYNSKVLLIDAMDKDALRTEIFAERRREFAFQGHRWFDLRRSTQPEIVRNYTEGTETKSFTLEQNDSRYTLRIPAEAVAANPELEIWP